MKLLDGKVALITGGTRGIGKSIVMAYAAHGAAIAFTYMQSAQMASQIEEELAQLGVKVKSYASDASNFEASEKLVQQMVADFGKIDILVNNAGITRDGLLMRMNEQQWDDVMAVNLKSAFNMSRSVAPLMMKQRSGSIINISSVVGLMGNIGQANYSASKAGMIGLTKSVAKELGARGIRCNAIAPGFIETEMTDNASQASRRLWLEMVPMRRGGRPEEVANVAVFLASDMASYVSGQVVSCCGGLLS
ncbi:MAG: 3-oxoacyl-[Paludibacteraceae bacterium]|nr:3-oxoacyl-[acyl-carrier-protein] reductase [Paludibacteraceae bacterium]